MAVPPPHVLARALTSIGWLGNQRLFWNKWALKAEQTIPGFSVANNVTYVAPLGKWALSILPAYQVFQGIPTVDKLDFQQSASLAFTGVVWSYYALLIRPQNFGSFLLCACNAGMGLVNGYNAYRRYEYDQQQEKKKLPVA